MNRDRSLLDLSLPASNGLRRGRTTGSCAAAAVKAAALLLLKGRRAAEVEIALPEQELSLIVPVKSVVLRSDGSAYAEVVKDAGDDPDVTNGATIFAAVCSNRTGKTRFFAGEGVGTVTEPGIRIGVGEPAINPAPRKMILQAVADVLGGRASPGFDLTIGCLNGQDIARRTFNPRLGITGGISILGTTGVVEPMSLSAYKASIEVYIRVALAGGAQCVAFMPGNIGITFARAQLQLPKKRIVHISNFLGFSLACAQQILEEDESRLQSLFVLGHPGKLAKVLDGAWDTHSQRSNIATAAIAAVAAEMGFEAGLVAAIEQANTAEAAVELLSGQKLGRHLWMEVEQRCALLMQGFVSRAQTLCVRLFAMNGAALGAIHEYEC